MNILLDMYKLLVFILWLYFTICFCLPMLIGED